MKRILIAMMLVAAPAFAAENPAAGKAEDAIKAVFTRVDTCVTKNDSACLSELFTDDATFSGPMSGAKVIKGKSEIIKSFERAAKEPSMKGVKQKRTIQNVRLIGQDRAIVDSSVEFSGLKVPEGMNPDEPRQTWHSTSIMALKDGKWLLEDVRFYAVELRSPTPAEPPTPVPTCAVPPTCAPCAQPPTSQPPAAPVQPNVPAAPPAAPAPPNVPPAPPAAPTPPAAPNVPAPPAAPPPKT